VGDNEKKTEQEKTRLRLPRRRYAAEVKRKGGGLYVLVPSEIAKFLEVGEGDKVIYFEDIENKIVLMLNPERVKVMIEGIGPVGLSFSIPKKLLEKIKTKDG
jgi:bifunctional DNA-binding transcriptional regulator/antitoxin component of YhaV-PrlF toxin-antitoxin module